MNIVIQSPLDMHIHLRQEAMLQCVAPLSAATFSGGVIMPNLVPPVDTLAAVLAYRDAIVTAIGDAPFAPYMTLFFREYTRDELAAAKPHIIGIKLYPAGMTTNSEAGVRSIATAEATIGWMAELGIPLLIHGEADGFVMDREHRFLTTYAQLATTYPTLKIVMEHITTAAAVELLDRYPNLFATVTLQHLLITLDDVAGGLLNPHLFCKPIAKRPEDRDALLTAALSAHPKLMFGSDSAPHPLSRKECAGCAAGVFTAPIAVAKLVELFARHDALGQLQAFLSDNACQIYGVTPPPKSVTVVDEPFTIPERYGDIVPMDAGQTIEWRVADVT